MYSKFQWECFLFSHAQVTIDKVIIENNSIFSYCVYAFNKWLWKKFILVNGTMPIISHWMHFHKSNGHYVRLEIANGYLVSVLCVSTIKTTTTFHLDGLYLLIYNLEIKYYLEKENVLIMYYSTADPVNCLNSDHSNPYQYPCHQYLWECLD